MDWIHCNQCYSQPTNSSPGYVLTSCGHIFCGNCENRDQVDQCKSCKSKCTVIKLTANNEKYLAAKNYIRKLEAKNALLRRELERYDKDRPKPVVSPRIPEFVFTPNTNLKPTLAFNSASTQNSAQSGKPNFSFRLPDIHAYQQYRNGMQNTPNLSPAESTPRNNSTSTPRNSSANIQQKMNRLTPIRGQSKFPMRTPPYSDFQGMRINSQKRK